MSDKYFVDTNLLLYAEDTLTGVKHERALSIVEELWNSGQGVLSTQVLQELSYNLRRKLAHPMPIEEIRAIVREYATWEVVINTPESILRALEIEGRYKTSFWDALIIQAAEEAGASILYSEDLTAGQNYGAVKVVNPLADPVAL